MQRTNLEVIDLIATTEAIEKGSVGIKTRDNYVHKLTDFILWLWTNRNDGTDRSCILTQRCIDSLSDAQARDDSSNTSRNNSNVKKAIKVMLKQLNRNNSYSSPIRLLIGDDNNSNILTYAHVSSFMHTKSKEVLVDKALAIRYCNALKGISPAEGGALLDEQELADDARWVPDKDGKVKVLVRLEASTYDGIRSSISFLYRETATTMPATLNSSMSLYIKGSRRINLLAKQMLGMKITEGKKHMTKAVYKKIAQILFESSNPEHIFAHLFFILDWNLMKRAENCVEAKIAHISFENDSLVFEFAKSKGIEFQWCICNNDLIL